MFVELGNDKAIEGYRDPKSDDPDLVRYRPLAGQRITRVDFPDGLGLQDAYSAIVDGVVPSHFQPDAGPAWIESDSEGLKMLLDEKYNTGQTTKPTGWGDK